MEVLWICKKKKSIHYIFKVIFHDIIHFTILNLLHGFIRNTEWKYAHLIRPLRYLNKKKYL